MAAIGSAVQELIESLLATATPREIADQFEIPQCGCEPQFIPLCVLLKRPCRDQKLTGACHCALTPGRGCEHVLSAQHDLSLDEWAELLQLLYPREYPPEDAPPLPPEPATFIDREHRVSVMALRHKYGYSLTPATWSKRKPMRQALPSPTPATAGPSRAA